MKGNLGNVLVYYWNCID